MNQANDEVLGLETPELALGYRFRDRALLLQALTHSSFINESSGEPAEDNERLEFLGDSVLDLGIATILMKQFPGYREGKMSKLRSSLVNDRSLAELASQLKLGDYLRLGRGEETTGGREKSSVLANSLEALIAAVYLDAGFEQALEVIETLFNPLIGAKESFLNGDSKSALQELCHIRFNAVPSYALLDEYGPDHAKTYQVSIAVNGNPLAVGSGRSKKEAERVAAASALEVLSAAQPEPSEPGP